jgi:signal transduction histidine kinase
MTDLSAAVVGAARQLEKQFTERGLKLTTNVESGITANIDAERIHQLVLNLLLNALEASPTGATIGITLDRQADNTAKLAVADQGKGIAGENSSRVFEPFYTTKSSGTGLGLAIVQSIVTRHGGKIDVISESQGGTTFVVTLPLAGDRT